MIRCVCRSCRSRSRSCSISVFDVVASTCSTRSTSGTPVRSKASARRSLSERVPMPSRSIGAAMRPEAQIARARLSSVAASPHSAAAIAVRRTGASNRLIGAASPSAQPESREVTCAFAIGSPSSEGNSCQPSGDARATAWKPGEALRPTLLSCSRERATKLPLRSTMPASQPPGSIASAISGWKIFGCMITARPSGGLPSRSTGTSTVTIGLPSTAPGNTPDTCGRPVSRAWRCTASASAWRRGRSASVGRSRLTSCWPPSSASTTQAPSSAGSARAASRRNPA